MAYTTNASDIPPPQKKRRVEIEIDESTPSSSSTAFSLNTVAAAASDVAVGVGVGFSALSNKQFKKSGKKSNHPSTSNTTASTSTTTSSPLTSPANSNPQKKEKKKRKPRRPPLPTPCSPDDVRFNDIRSLLGPSVVQRILDSGTGEEWDAPVDVGQEVEVVVSELGCGGDAMSIYHAPPLPTQPSTSPTPTLSPKQKPWILITPFALPNERIRVRVYKNDRLCSYTDLVEIVEPNYELRGPPNPNPDGSGSGSGSSTSVKCKYFGECGGCQYQMIPYQTQLDLKQRVILKAYTYYSGFANEEMPYIPLPTPTPSPSSSSLPWPSLFTSPSAAASSSSSLPPSASATSSPATLVETCTSTLTSTQPHNGLRTRIPILPTQSSPLQYAYRTKITPHFQVPRWWGRYVRNRTQKDHQKEKEEETQTQMQTQKNQNGRKEGSAKEGGSGEAVVVEEAEQERQRDEEQEVDAVERERQGEAADVDVDVEMDLETATATTNAAGSARPNLDWLKIGFNHATRGRCVDIEECPIATRTINDTLPILRAEVLRNPERYTRGATLLLRDSVNVDADARGGGDVKINDGDGGGRVEREEEEGEEHVCVSDPKGTIRERVRVPAPRSERGGSEGREGVGVGGGERSFDFEFSASAFFQNNNSMIGVLVAYVRDAIFGLGFTPSYSASAEVAVAASTSPSVTTTAATAPPSAAASAFKFDAPTNLIDAYCGSGLFSITLSEYFDHVVGIEISEEGVRSARRNAELTRNRRGTTRTTRTMGAGVGTGTGGNADGEHLRFIKGDASNIFDSVKDFESRKTVVIIDPPRKGCDIPFLTSLLTFAPQTIVYVSCNVHTQARDVGVLVRGGADNVNGSAPDGVNGNGNGDGDGNGAEPRKVRYRLDSLRGFDMFPQTAHVESVAVLRLVE